MSRSETMPTSRRRRPPRQAADLVLLHELGGLHDGRAGLGHDRSLVIQSLISMGFSLGNMPCAGACRQGRLSVIPRLQGIPRRPGPVVAVDAVLHTPGFRSRTSRPNRAHGPRKTPGMNALVYEKSIPRYLASALAARLDRRRFFPRVSPLRLAEVPFDPPAGWVRLKTLMCGICGSDLGLLKGHESVLLEPYASMPSVLGHEIVAVANRPRPAPDSRRASGWGWSRFCPARPGACRPAGSAPPGTTICARIFCAASCRPGRFWIQRQGPGGMAERTAAHPSRLFPSRTRCRTRRRSCSIPWPRRCIRCWCISPRMRTRWS
jgi:hypothetical protein